MRRFLPLLTLSTALVSSAAVAAPQACPAGLHAATTAELFFGLPGVGHVSEADWNGFVATEVAPRFAETLPVNDVYSQWNDPMGPFGRESTKALLVVLSGPGERPDLDVVRQAYMQRFHQQSVMLIKQPACVSF